MKKTKAIAVCVGLFLVYGVFSLAMGWKHLGGALPLLLLVSAMIFVYKTMTED